MLQAAHVSGAPYDVVFLDWRMPIISGLEVLSYFRGLPEHSGTAFVMLTAESEQRQVMRAVKAGAISYIIKPADAKTVRLRLLDVLNWLRVQASTTAHSAQSLSATPRATALHRLLKIRTAR